MPRPTTIATLTPLPAVVALLLLLLFFQACDRRDPAAPGPAAAPTSAATPDASPPPEPQAPAREPLPPGAMLFPTGDPGTSFIMVEHLADSAAAALGQSYPFQIRITNLSDDLPLQDIVVSQTLPDDFDIVESDPDSLGRHNGDQLWFIEHLAPGEVRTIRAVGVVDDLTAGDIDSRIRISYTPVLHTTIPIAPPALQLTKAAPETWSLCEPLFSVKYIATNIGAHATAPGEIRDLYPEGVVGPAGTNEVVIDVPALEPGAGFEASVPVRATRTGDLTSRATLTTHSGLTAHSRRVTTSIRQAVLALDISGPEADYTHTALRYTFTVTNTGNDIAADTRIHATIGPDIDLVGAAGETPPTLSDGIAIVNVGEVPPGESRDAVLTLMRREPGDITIDAQALAPCARPATAPDSDSGAAPSDHAAATFTTRVQGLASLLLDVADTSDPIRAGDEVLYEVTVTNIGTAPDGHIELTVTLPDGLTLIEAGGQTDVAPMDGDGRTIRFAPLGRLAPRDSAAWYIRAATSRPGDARVLVELASPNTPKPVTDSESTRIY